MPKRRGCFWFCWVLFLLTQNQNRSQNPHAGYEKEKPELLNPTHIPTYTQLGTSQGIL